MNPRQDRLVATLSFMEEDLRRWSLEIPRQSAALLVVATRELALTTVPEQVMREALRLFRNRHLAGREDLKITEDLGIRDILVHGTTGTYLVAVWATTGQRPADDHWARASALAKQNFNLWYRRLNDAADGEVGAGATVPLSGAHAGGADPSPPQINDREPVEPNDPHG